MWVKWVKIHESFGVPRAAYDYRQYLELNGLQVRMTITRKKASVLYILQVPVGQEQQARTLLADLRKKLARDIH